jgi:hypothetical protein
MATNSERTSHMPKKENAQAFSFFNTLKEMKSQPKMKQIPPSGVTGPRTFNQSAPNKFRVHKKYSEPENKMIPQKNKA